MRAINKVLILGGGIAGMCLAIALRQRACQVDLVELNPEWNALGIGIALQGPAMRALNSLDLLDRCIGAGFGISKLARGNSQGEIYERRDAPRLNGPDYPATLGMMRPVFHSILADATLECGANVRLGLTVESLEQRADGVAVALTDASRGVYDLVVGADGINSKVRELVFGPELQPRYTGQMVWRATVPRPPEVDAIVSFQGPRNKTGFNPVSQDLMSIYLVTNSDEKVRLPQDQLPRLFRAELADFGGLVGEACQAVTQPDQVVCRPAEVLFAPPPWYRGRVLLIGDAAHATTPHMASGAMIAIEDAVVLAELVDSSLSLEEIFEEFMERRYDRCRLVIENSLQMGEWEKHPEDPTADPAGLLKRSFEQLAAPI